MKIAKQNKNKFKVYFDRIEVSPDVFEKDVDVKILVKNALGEYWVNSDEELAELEAKIKENDFEVFTNIFIYPVKQRIDATIKSQTEIKGTLF